MPPNTLRTHDLLVTSLRAALRQGTFGLTSVPDVIKQLLREEAWKKREVEQTGQLVTFERFQDFVQAPAPNGLGADIDTLKRFCRDDAEAAQLLATVVAPIAKHGEIGGGHSRVDNIKSAVGGTSADYLTARIARDHPDILERMQTGDFKSVRAAAIEAGIIKLPTALDTLQKVWRKASADEHAAFLAWIQEV